VSALIESTVRTAAADRVHARLMATSPRTAVFERERDIYVAMCPELAIANHGTTTEEAKTNRGASELEPVKISQDKHCEFGIVRETNQL